VQFQVLNPLTGEILQSPAMKPDERLSLPQGPGGLILTGRILDADGR